MLRGVGISGCALGSARSAAYHACHHRAMYRHLNMLRSYRRLASRVWHRMWCAARGDNAAARGRMDGVRARRISCAICWHHRCVASAAFLYLCASLSFHYQAACCRCLYGSPRAWRILAAATGGGARARDSATAAFGTTLLDRLRQPRAPRDAYNNNRRRGARRRKRRRRVLCRIAASNQATSYYTIAARHHLLIS